MKKKELDQYTALLYPTFDFKWIKNATIILDSRHCVWVFTIFWNEQQNMICRKNFTYKLLQSLYKIFICKCCLHYKNVIFFEINCHLVFTVHSKSVFIFLTKYARSINICSTFSKKRLLFLCKTIYTSTIYTSNY